MRKGETQLEHTVALQAHSMHMRNKHTGMFVPATYHGKLAKTRRGKTNSTGTERASHCTTKSELKSGVAPGLSACRVRVSGFI
jgi:hypothetical protein